MSSKLTKHVNTIARMVNHSQLSSQLLLFLVNDIIDLAKIDTGAFSIHLGDFPFRDVMVELTKFFTTQCEQKRIVFKTDIHDQLRGVMVKSD